MHTATDKQASNVMGVALVAAVVGAVVGMLFAPKRGTEMRDELKGRYQDMKTKAQTTADDAHQKLADGVETVSSKAKDVADKAKDTADKATDKVHTTKNSNGATLAADDMATATDRRPRL